VGRFGASRGFQLNWVGHFHASRGFQLNWHGRFGASRRLQLINTRLIPNTALYCSFFLLRCVMCIALCRRKQVIPKRLVVFGLGVTTWPRMLRGQALSVGRLFRPQPWTSSSRSSNWAGSIASNSRRSILASNRSSLSLEREQAQK